MPPKKKAPKKKAEEEESDEEVVEEQTDFTITVDDEIKPFTNDYEELVRFDSLDKLPSEVVFEIFSFLPCFPYYFKLQLLNKFYKDKFQEIINETKHLDLTPINLQNNAIWPKAIKMINDCGSSLKSIQLGELSYKWSEIRDSIVKKCKVLEELALVTPTMYFSSLFKREGYNYGYFGGGVIAYDEDKKNRDVWSNTLTTLNIIGLEKPRKGRRNHSYLLTSATVKYILEKFPKLKQINFILTNYTEAYIQNLYDSVVRNRKRLLEYREKGGSTDGLFERNSLWYEESLGIVDFEITDVKISVQGNIGKLNSIDAAKSIVEVYNINPNTKFEFLFQKNSNGTLLDQIIGSRAAYKQKHQVMNYLLCNGSLISNLSGHSWSNILKQPNEKIKKLLEEITKWVATKYEGKMFSSNTFASVVPIIPNTAEFIKNLQVMLDNGWSDVKDPNQDFISPSIVSNELCTFMIEKAGCKINPTTASSLLTSALFSHHSSLPIVLKLLPEKLTDVTPTGRPTLTNVIMNSDVPDYVITYIFHEIVKTNYALNVFTNANTGDTIIHELISSDRLEPLRLLLDMLKDQERISKIINIQNQAGNTALHTACQYNKIQLAKDLVNHYSANKNLYNNSNQFAYDLLKDGFLSFSPEILKPDSDKVEELQESIKQKEKELAKASKKKKSPKKAASKRKKEESSEEEEEEKPRRSTRKKTKKEVHVDLTEEEEAPEESEEEEKPKRKPRTSKKK